MCTTPIRGIRRRFPLASTFSNCRRRRATPALPTTTCITTPNGLPLLDPVRAIPVIGNPIADLLQPDLTTIVNLGYGNPNFGWSQGPADVQTYFGLFPHVSQALIAQDLIVGAQQGAHAFVSDIHAETSGVSLASLSHSLTSMSGNGRSGAARADVGAEPRPTALSRPSRGRSPMSPTGSRLLPRIFTPLCFRRQTS